MRSLFGLAAVMAAVKVGGQASQDVCALSLSSAVALALEKNPSLAAEREEVQAAIARLKMARAEGRAVGSANAYLSAATMPSIMPSPEAVMPRMYANIQPEPQFRPNLTFMYPLSTGGRIGSRVRAAEAQVQATTKSVDAVVLDLAYAVRAAYWQALYRRDLVRVHEENLNEQRERLRVDQAKYDAGKIPLYYVLRDKAELARAEQELTSARRDAETALLELRKAIGLQMSVPIELTDKLVYDPAIGDADAEKLLSQALANRPEILALDARTEAARREVTARKAAYRPQVDAMLMLDAEKASGMGAQGGYAVGIAASLPLLDGGKRKQDVAEAEAMVRRLQNERRALELQVELELRTALLGLAAAKKNVRTAMETKAAAEEDYRVIKAGYEAGKLINLEVVSALTALTEARVNEVKAVLEYCLAADAVQRAAGVLPVVET